MEFGVLGGLSVEDSDGRHLPTAPKQRQLLGLLLLHAGEVMPVRTCVSEIWGEYPPPSAATTLQTYVMHLRRLLARMPSVGSREAAHERLRTTGQGYLISVRTDELDLLRFEQFVGQAGRATDDYATMARLLSSALALWDRPVLADVRTGPVLQSAVTHWERRRLEVHEAYLDALLRIGRHRDVLAELAVLTRRHPTHETLHARYMTALYQTGRVGDALDVAARLTSRLARDLGVAPGPAIGRLQSAIRRGGSIVAPFPPALPSVPGLRRA
ncbi:AfsR/SARP family transcriptional regulator [Streptomyces spinoverrucosus]|uniref:AfsR/SARP family transcriptional regulator n=1 Tax=Streptomyces spinoverrucosus TaxID=284043 RepID=UPI0018C3F893|nr:AfsR/SARP family transcriptional regulator [Streptomyces spinoverrucosus]MBG0851936.1 AfsR/SARP family transcriptional regulator [Streptomyces spinoverrucosus]